MRAVVQGTILLFGFLFAFAGTAQAGSCEKPVGRLVSLQGKVEARSPEQTTWRAARLDDSFCPGDALRTGARSRAALVLANETIVRLDQLTTLTLSGLDDQATSWVDLLNGAAHFLSRTPRALKVKTPYVNAGVEGTEFVVRADQDEGSVTVLEGRVRADNPQGVVVLGGGESAAARAGQAPATRLVARPRDAVQWSLYYPPLFDPNALTAADWTDSARRSVDAYLAGDSAAAFAAIDAVPENVADARFFNYRAGLLLSVGRVDEAQADIARALGLAAEDAHAQALQSVVALARNDKPAALDLARKANARGPESVPAWIALSYAQQAAFDLDGARASVEQASRRDPRNVLVLARLSELWLSLGDLDRALETANGAVALNPNIARTQTVLGFAYLTQIKTADAKQAFEKAIGQDSADPLPRLGLGLALIRTGELEAGRREIEIAAALDPNNALIRSYLGKAYYEEKRNRLAAAQLDMARQLDPNDPTPWFYDAIRKQTENRPVEALNDLQKSIELNDNRAVYRSRLLLDEDLAMRGASLARIHRNLGLDPVAQAEATRSIALDPANHSAHRFLSDSYVGRPRYEIARASELLQSQLLQPTSMSPVQPQSAETNLNLLSSSGPREAAFNEYTPLFARNDIQVTASALAGNNSTLGDELAISGLQDRISYSLGQFYYKTDGFRENNDVEHNIYTAFAQVRVAEGVDVQMEFRRRKTEQGDLRMVFDPNFVPTERRTLDQDVARLGVHITPSPHSDVVASLVSSTHQEGFSRAEPFQTITGTSDAEGYDAQLQYLFRATAISGVVGAGWYEVKSDDLLLLIVPGPPPIPLSDGVFRTKQQNGYVYLNVPLGGRITTTLGASYDSVSSDQSNLDINEFSPKLGLQWDATPGLRLRAAAFDTTKRALLINQTIEPTQVAGFNQFFDDLDGTRAHSLAFAVDMVHKKGLYSGLEAHRRRLEVPIFSAGNIIEENRSDDEYRAYLYWVPHPRWSYSVDYRLEALRGEFPDADPTKLDTTSIPIGIRYFHPNGVFGSLITTYVRQEIGYTFSAPPSTELRKEDFTVVDLAVGYRFPRRLGTLSVEVKNLFKRDFLYQDNSFVTADQFNYSPRYIPDRSAFVKVMLNF
jgi:ferric-dicitrate binding protein FerR (iron transport regulator)